MMTAGKASLDGPYWDDDDEEIEPRDIAPNIENRFRAWMDSIKSYDGNNELRIFDILEDLMYLHEDNRSERDILRCAILESPGLAQYVVSTEVRIFVEDDFQMGVKLRWRIIDTGEIKELLI